MERTPELKLKLEDSEHIIDLMQKSSAMIEQYAQVIKIQQDRIEELEEEVESLNLRLMEVKEQ